MKTLHKHSPGRGARRASASVGQVAARHPWLEQAGKAGWLAKGVVYLIAGVIALALGVQALGWSDSSGGAADQEASPTGALKTIAEKSGGGLLLWALALGMFLYAAWRVISAALPGENDAKSAAKRVGYLVSAAIYTSLGVTAVRLTEASSNAGQDGNSSVTSASGGLMDSSSGRFAIGLAGVIAIAVGLYHIWQGVRRDVEDELDLSGMAPQRRTWLERLGAVGEIGRGVAIALIGFFLLRAAVTYDPNDATGVDGALRRMAEEPWGKIVVLVVGAGFVAHGLFCATTFHRRRLEAP